MYMKYNNNNNMNIIHIKQKQTGNILIYLQLNLKYTLLQVGFLIKNLHISLIN